MNIEKIVSSAIKFKIIPMEEHFHILCAKRHADILEYMFNHHIEYDKNTAVQGFMTNENRFVDRHEGAYIAFDAGQINDRSIEILYSEDIWPEE